MRAPNKRDHLLEGRQRGCEGLLTACGAVMFITCSRPPVQLCLSLDRGLRFNYVYHLLEVIIVQFDAYQQLSRYNVHGAAIISIFTMLTESDTHYICLMTGLMNI